jgi:hypothetical protein
MAIRSDLFFEVVAFLCFLTWPYLLAQSGTVTQSVLGADSRGTGAAIHKTGM